MIHFYDSSKCNISKIWLIFASLILPELWYPEVLKRILRIRFNVYKDTKRVAWYLLCSFTCFNKSQSKKTVGFGP